MSYNKIFAYKNDFKNSNKKININNIESIQNVTIPYFNKVPLKIFQTWCTKNLPKDMERAVDDIKLSNPEFEHYLFDDDDCRNFIKDNYSKDILNAFDKLVPGAYKADLWRYCVLYFYGGVYLDIKFLSIENFKLIDLIEKECFVNDLESSDFGIYNGLIIVKQRNNKLLECINEIVINTKNNYYGDTFLHVTGPKLLDKFFSKEEKKNFSLILELKKNSNIQLIRNKKTNKIILSEYSNYREEQKNNSSVNHYSELWHERKIYNV